MVTADDLTGAQEMGALPASKRLRTLVKTALQTSGNYDAVVIDTESRNLQPDEAARRVRAAASSIPRIEPSVQMFKKKVDSTLRGPIGAELLALSAALGGGRAIVLTPAYPQLGRLRTLACGICLGMRQEVNSFASAMPSQTRTFSQL